jgi:hypothetical protein
VYDQEGYNILQMLCKYSQMTIGGNNRTWPTVFTTRKRKMIFQEIFVKIR